jgi:hypothetical protein
MTTLGTATQTGTTPARTPATGLAEQFVLRVAGLPIEAVAPLRTPAAAAWAADVLDRTDRLAAAGAALSEPLGALVKAEPDETSRRRLLALRRAVFNGTAPKDPPPVDLPALHAWLADRAALDALLREGDDLVGAELARTRAALRDLVATEDRLRTGIVLASPTLDGQLDGWTGGADKKSRRIERSLLSYLYRTAAKASPFSTFTAVAAGRFDTGEVTVDDTWVSHPRLNVVVLQRLAELIAAAPGPRDDLPVAPSAGWAADADRVRFVRRTVTAGDDEAAVSFDAAQDRLFFLRRSGVLDRMLALFGSRGPLPRGELVRWLGADADATPAEADRYVSALLDLGLLQLPALRTDVHERDPLAAFQRALRELDRPWATELADGLDGPQATIEAYGRADARGRRWLLADLRRDLTAVAERLGAATLPQVLLYEDVHTATGTADRAAWTRLAARPLARLARVLPVFDVALPQRLTLEGFFLARFGVGGRCDDLLRFVHDFHEDLFDQYLTYTATQPAADPDGSPRREDNWLGVPGLTALDAARAELVTRMRALWAGAAPGTAELTVPEEALAAVEAALDAPAGFAPHSHFVQLADRPDDPLVVLNNSYGGLAFPFTRFTHALGADVTGRLRAALAAARPDGAVFAEVTAGAATTNLNLHDRLVEHEIVCPGETSQAPPEARIELADLVLEHDPAAGRLRLRSVRLGREVVPLYLGYLVPMVLPEIPRTLLLLSPTSRAAVDVWRGVPKPDAVDGVTTRPRVRYGPLVLARRRWSALAGDLPRGGTEAGRWLAWQRWRRIHGLPPRVYATVHPVAGGWAGGTKPQYVDLDSLLSLVALDGLLRDPVARVVFEEALPDEDELHVRSPRGRHVAELAVEVLG